MRSSLGLLLFVAVLVLLRSAIVLLDMAVEVRAEHSRLVYTYDIDPAALFYTNSARALAAEKDIRRRMSAPEP